MAVEKPRVILSRGRKLGCAYNPERVWRPVSPQAVHSMTWLGDNRDVSFLNPEAETPVKMILNSEPKNDRKKEEIGFSNHVWVNF